MIDLKCSEILKNQLNFNDKHLEKLSFFHDELLNFNKKYNLIGKSTESNIWNRHFLDSAQLVKYINFNDQQSLSDLGTGAGFPGLVLAIYNPNINFHVKLYEKSRVKCLFLKEITKKLKINCFIYDNDYQSHIIRSNYITCRAFKKMAEILAFSRENVDLSHKLIILKGKNAQAEANKAFKDKIFKYRLAKSMTSKDSHIIIVDIKK